MPTFCSAAVWKIGTHFAIVYGRERRGDVAGPSKRGGAGGTALKEPLISFRFRRGKSPKYVCLYCGNRSNGRLLKLSEIKFERRNEA